MKFKKIPLNPSETSLHQSALRAASAFRSAQYSLLVVVDKVDRNRFFEKLGCRSSFVYCVKHLSLSEDLACSFLAVARRSREVPALAHAVKKGLPLSKANKIVPVINPANQNEWLARARDLSYRDLEREIARVSPRAAHPDKAKPISEEFTKLELTLSNEAFADLLRAQDLLSTKLGRAATLSETVAAMSGEYVERHDPVKKAERSKSSNVINIVRARDEGRCQTFDMEGKQCDEKRWLHIHHIQPRSKGGTDTPDNLITICSFHHRMFHRFEEGIYPARDG